MQIGIDLGASKIESVVLDEQGNEKHRQRVDCPKNYNSIIEEIKKIVSEIESKIDKTLPLFLLLDLSFNQLSAIV